MPRQEYLQYIDLLTEQEEMKDTVVASLIAAGWVMGMAREEDPINRDQITISSRKLLSEPAFQELMKDPETAQLARGGNIVELQIKLAEKAEMLDERQAYQRGPEKARDDSLFLKAAIKGLKDEVKKAPVMKTKQLERYNEMIKQLEAAQMKCEQGAGLSGEEAKAMVTAVQKYNDKGTRQAGGTMGKKAVGFTKCMCLMQRFMPERQFDRYCAQINEKHPKRTMKRGDFGIERLNGYTKSAVEWQQENMRNLQRTASQETMAMCVALAKLSAGNKEAPVQKHVLDAEIKQLMKPGSAFQRALKDPDKLRQYQRMAQDGKADQLGRQIYKDSQTHAAQSANYQFGRSVRALTGGALNNYYTQAHLANILAANELASQSDAALEINIGAFRRKAAEISADPAFQKVAQRYQQDPAFRSRMNDSFIREGTATSLQMEYHNAMQPAPQRQRPERQNPEQQQPAVQPGPVR